MELDRIYEEKKREERVGLREWKGSSESRVLWGELPECCPAYNKNKHTEYLKWTWQAVHSQVQWENVPNHTEKKRTKIPPLLLFTIISS